MVPMVSHNKKFIFLHTPRTAGTSIERALEQYCDYNPIVIDDLAIPKGFRKRGWTNSMDGLYMGHSSPDLLKQYLGDECWNSFYKFNIIRNPWIRVISMYANSPQNRESFKDWLFNDQNLDHQRKLFKSQLHWIMDKQGNDLVDNIYKYETLSEDWRTICDDIGIEHTPLKHHNSSAHFYYTEYYDQETIDYVGHMYEQEITRFNYTFE